MRKASPLYLLAIGVALSGCSGLKLQWSASYQTENLAADLQAARQVDADRAATALTNARTEAAQAR